jgi:hypothetical protein
VVMVQGSLRRKQQCSWCQERQRQTFVVSAVQCSGCWLACAQHALQQLPGNSLLLSKQGVSCCNRMLTSACLWRVFVFDVGQWGQLLTNCIAMCQGHVIEPQMPVIRAVAGWNITAAGSTKCSVHDVFLNLQVLQSCSASS